MQNNRISKKKLIRKVRELLSQSSLLRITNPQKGYEQVTNALLLIQTQKQSEELLQIEGELHLLGMRLLLRIGISLLLANNQYSEHLEKLANIVQTINSPQLLILYNFYAASKLFNESKYFLAYDILQDTVPLITGEDTELKGNIYHLMGVCRLNTSDYPIALEHLLLAENIIASLQYYDQSKLAGIYLDIAGVHLYTNELENAMSMLKRGLSIAEQCGDTYLVGTAISNMGLVYSEMHLPKEAIEYFLRSIYFFEELHNILRVGKTYINIGAQWLKLQDYKQAESYYLKGDAIIRENGSDDLIAAISVHLAQLYANSNASCYNPDKAVEYFKTAAKLADSMNLTHLLSHIHEQWSDFLENIGEFRDSLAHFKLKTGIDNTIFSQDNARKIAELEAKHILDIQKTELEITGKLLEKFLPSDFIHRLKAKEENIADRYDSVAVLFADIVGFTKISLQIPAATVMELINFIFGRFDEIMERHGCERIKTIGDGYMAICGAPKIQVDHAERLARAAIEILDDIMLPEPLRYLLPPGLSFGLRVGLHIGPLVCGVVGSGKYQFDVYGDTVNTASRMESHGVEDKVQITEEYKQHLHSRNCQEFTFIPRGEIDVKGKGIMSVYLLEKAIKS